MNNKVVHIVVNSFDNDSRVIRECKTLSEHGNDLTVIAYLEEGLLERESNYGFKTIRIKLFTKKWSSHPFIQVIKYIEFLIRALFTIKSIKPDICHGHDPDGLIIAYFVKLIYKCQLIYDSHELWAYSNHMRNYNNILYKIGRWIEKIIISKSDAVITVSNSIAKVIQSENNVSNISVIRNMPEIITKDYHFSREDFQFPECKNIIIYVGNVVNGRGINNLIQAMTNVEDDIGLVIMGRESPYRRKMIDRVNKLQLTDRILFVDAVRSEKVVSVCKLANAGIISSRNVCESYYLCLPNKMFEYIQAGLPVLCSEFPEMKNIIQHYHVGLTFNPDNPIHIANKINEIFVTEDKYFGYCDASIEAAKILNWNNEQAKLLAVYNQH